MSTNGLDSLFNPKTVALIGASEVKDSFGRILSRNLVDGFKGDTYLVNPNKEEILGKKVFGNIQDIPGEIDLAIITTPAKTVPNIVGECGEASVPASIVISSGFGEVGGEGEALEEEISEIRKNYGMRLLGPNSMGVMRSSIGLNATVAHKSPSPGSTAFISQSGGLGPSILDQQGASGTGFSSIVSVGNMIDVDFGDLIDYFRGDPKTQTILMHVESLRSPQKFMSAARCFSQTGPIILEKPAKYEESRTAVKSHIGVRPEDDSLYEALFCRSGVVRVDEIADLFSCSEALAKKMLPKGPNLAIITNAAGPGIMATDTLIEKNGNLATLSEGTIETLKNFLPHYATKSNPVDTTSDAEVKTYIKCAKACLKDENVDGLLVIYTPQGIFYPARLAKALVDLSEKNPKPILTCWMGEETIRQSKRILRSSGVPVVNTPQQGVRIFMYLYEYLRNKQLLYQKPELLSAHKVPLEHQLNQKEYIKSIIENLESGKRWTLMDDESKKLLRTYGIPAVETYVAHTANKAADLSEEIGFPVVLKARSLGIVERRKGWGFKPNINNRKEVRQSFQEILDKEREAKTETKFRGVVVQEVVDSHGCEVKLQLKKFPKFGSVISLGTGGVIGEVCKDKAVGFPPLNQVHASRLIERTKIKELLQKIGDHPKSRIKYLQEYLARLSQLAIDFPEIKKLDFTLVGLGERFTSTDASIIFDEEAISQKWRPHDHLTIEPYPLGYIERSELRDGTTVVIRPVKPEDEEAIIDLFETFSEETWRKRFFGPRKEVNHKDIVRFTNVDYKREIIVVGEKTEGEKGVILGMGGLTIDLNEDSAEFSLVVGDPWQGLGMGKKLLQKLIEIARDKRIERLWAVIKANSPRVISLCEDLGFSIIEKNSDTVVMSKTIQPSSWLF